MRRSPETQKELIRSIEADAGKTSDQQAKWIGTNNLDGAPAPSL
jgi:hypothetical protein